jgi:thiamine biosynthesis lipoprotein
MSQKLVFLLLFVVQQIFGQLPSSRTVLNLMGSRFELVAIHEDEEKCKTANREAIEEIRRIENLISSWKVTSETYQINKNAGIQPVKVSEELFNLIERSKKVSDLTDGAFDISFASVDPVWTFDGRTIEAPDTAIVNQSVKNINYQNIVLDKSNLTVYLQKPGMKIGFGAIGKGYAANMAMKKMKSLGIDNGLVNAGGDLICWGHDEDGKSWKIGIADPEKKEEFIAWLNIDNMSVVTSGNYEKYVIIDGKKYGHIINPASGFPVKGIKSVTVVSPDAELSDALATSVFVMGVQKGLELINRLKNVDCLLVDDHNKMWTSDKLELNNY